MNVSYLIADAIATTVQTTAPQGEGTFSLVMIVAIFVLFYFMLVRPQNRRAKEHRELVNKLAKGDEVITSSGMLAKIVSIDEQYMKVLIAQGVEVTIQRSAVSAVLPKGTVKNL